MGRQSVHRGGSSAISRYLKVLLPSSLSNSGKLRISDELARHWDGGDVGSGGVALLASAPVVPFGMVWRVEVGRDAEGAFLGRGWPEFAAEHGFGTGWFIVLRHEPGGGVLTVKAFDTTCCLREFGRPLIGVPPNHGGDEGHGGASRRPQFINVLLPPSMEKMVVPPRFVRKFIAEPVTGSSTTAIRFSPRGKFCRVTVDKDHTGNVFFSGGWSRFLASNGIAEYDVLLLRHEGNMVFTVNVFGPDGSQKGCKDQDTSPPSRGKGLHQRGDKTGSGKFRTEEEDLPSSNRKQKSVAKKLADTDKTGPRENNMAKKPADGKENSERPRGSSASSNNPLPSTKNVYEIGPPSLMKKEISKYTRLNHLAVAGFFCRAIGLQRTCEITLRTNKDEVHGLRSWKVGFIVYAARRGGEITRGWRRFCKDNGIEEGDVCTFNIVETTLWHVDITRCRC